MEYCNGCGQKFSDTDVFDVTGNQNHAHRFKVCRECKKLNAELESKIAPRLAQAMINFREEVDSIAEAVEFTAAVKNIAEAKKEIDDML